MKLIDLNKQCCLKDDSGATAIEYSLLVALFAIIIIGGITILKLKPDLLDKGIAIAVFGGLAGMLAWSSKRAVSSLENRAQLVIMEELSRGKTLSRKEIVTIVYKEYFLLRLFKSVPVDALATLNKEGKIVIEKGLYKTIEK